MRFTVLTLFPDMTRQGFLIDTLGRVEERDSTSFDIRNIRDYTTEWHGRVNDAPYGGGAGILIQIGPILRRHRSATADLPKTPWVIYIALQGRQFTQADARVFAAGGTLLILCRHYEGVGERVLEFLGTEPYSIGGCVLTDRKLPAMVTVGVINRMVPGVPSNQENGEIESLEGNLPEYPQYTRPEVHEGLCVPPVLLLGGYKKVTQWRQEQALL